jgi:small neutral amino acid transporter SnatA (MarC family)
LYLYDREHDTVAPEYDMVRHTGAVMGLYRAALEGLPRALPSADRGATWALDRLREHDGWAAVEYQGEVETGATALLVAGLVLRRGKTGDTRHDAVLRRLGRFLVAQTERSGAVRAYYDPGTESPVPGKYSPFFTGETWWALASLHRAFPREGWGEPANRIGAYIATSRDDAEDHWPPLADHWAGYGLAETVEFPERGRPPLTAHEASYARRQAGLFGGQVRWSAVRFDPWGALVRPGGVLRGGGYGVISEGLNGLWRASRADPRLADLREPIAERARCIAGLAIRAQSGPDDAEGARHPQRIVGAWFRDGETRMDDQQHALAGLLRTIPIVAAGDGSDPLGSSGPPPTAWLWALALLLALNPARAAFAVPRRSAGIAAGGAALGGLAVCIVSLLADPLLDALDVSDSSFRLAAAVVAVIAGAGDLFRRPPAREPALAGWKAALVPVAIPVVARPALLILAVGAGADHSAGVTAAAMAIGVALLSGLVAGVSTEGPDGRVLRWAARLLAAGLIACGVVLGVDGVWDV